MRSSMLAVMMMLLAGGGALGDIVWTGAGGNDLWTTAMNWNVGHAPVDTDLNIFFGAGGDAGNDLIVIDSTMHISINCDMYGPEWGLDVDIDGGSLTQVYNTPVAGEGFVFAPIADVGAQGIINVRNGGALEVQELLLGDNWWFAGHPYITLNVYDTSSVTANGWMWLGGRINLYGGSVDITGSVNFATANGFAHIDLEHGMLTIRDDGFLASTAQGWEDGGFLTAFGGTDDVIIDDAGGDVVITAAGRLAAKDPDAQPVNPTGSVGTLLSQTEVGVTLSWNAGIDPNTAGGLPFNPNIVTHYVWAGAEGESMTLRATVPQTSETDPANDTYIVLSPGTQYNWRIEEGLDNGTGNAFAAGDPNNIYGRTWSFRTKAAIPELLSQPANAIANPNASFTITADTATAFQWYKEAGETDTALANGGKYSGVNTATLTVTGAGVAEEGQYYCIAENDGAYSTPSDAAWLWTPRLMGHWKLDGDMLDSVADSVAGAPAHNGTLADPNWAAVGIDAQAMAFFGDADYVAIDNPDFFNFYPLGFTVSGWYKSTGSSGWALPISKLQAGAAGWLIGTDPAFPANQATFIIEVPNTRIDGNSAVNVNDGQWHMLTAAYDPATTTIRLFTDGDEHASAVVDLAAAPLSTAPLCIGGWSGANSVMADMDDVRIYSYALTPLEAAQLYLALKPGEWVCVEDAANPLTVDVNGDCRTTLADFAQLAAEWLECQRIPASACSL